MYIKGFLKRFGKDESGVVIIIAALMLTVLMGFMALAIDVGLLYFQQKKLQTEADLTAVSAASNLWSDPDEHALETVKWNGLEPDALTDIKYGRFIRTEDAKLEPGRSWVEPGDNAAQVTLNKEVPLYFAQIFLDQDTTRIQAEATAARYDSASFSLGSRLLRIDEGILNAVLSAALGTTVGLDVLDYEALADADIDLLSFSDALASRLDVTAGNYEVLLTKEADLTNIAGALLDTGLGEEVTTALTTIINSGASELLNVSDLILIEGEDVKALAPDLLPKITVKALDLLKASVDIINAERHIESDLDVGIDGLVSVDFDLVVGEKKAKSGWITIGERGTTLHTAQTRLKLDLKLEPSIFAPLGLDILSVNLLPLYIEVAGATASLTDIDCSVSEPDDVIARFDTGTDPLNGVTGTHVAEVFLGQFDPPDFNDNTTPLNKDKLHPADLLKIEVDLFLAKVEIAVLLEAAIPLGISEQAQTEFILSEVSNYDPPPFKEIGSGDLLTGVLSAVMKEVDVSWDFDLELLEINFGFLTAIVEATLEGTLNTLQSGIPPILSGLTLALDDAIDELMETLGLGIGEADLALHGLACDKLLLVR
ncbi:hypothetical protein DSM110093_03803 (plasmid) [Sulfitobacter sp. DSM 110093]|uniref:pilus assembly protein TadG-related protein n=1 Tax=Sulfitobacter sp. DSM 110093 TaxID=2883127 RepID=UPI001FAD0839|nr:pilus assembly protein TadG-related protein [Sulfitobacter sp. DSM 110093]UOA33707.1 hypothetical protein DSM110093_03542 [Sulfitobacter sp. DSM 110093]UOA33968.1 hypothetical protein DSM110093_03803 [Sulfitobacter sp. DSM 110093]